MLVDATERLITFLFSDLRLLGAALIAITLLKFVWRLLPEFTLFSSFKSATNENADGVDVQELIELFKKHGAAPNVATAQAGGILEKFSPSAILDHKEYPAFLAKMTSAIVDKTADKSRVHELELVHADNPLRASAAALIDAAKAVCATLPKLPNGCAYVVADHQMNEIANAHEGAGGRLLLNAARAKMRALKVGAVKPLPPVPMPIVLRVLSGQLAEFPYEGCVLIEYADPETKRPVRGYLATAGRATGLQDLKVSRDAAKACGLKETWTPNTFRLDGQ